jgi:hypothetical protein
MATYLQGVAPYIPEIQPFAPDFTLYSQVLQFKQGRQDAARDQLSTMYGSLLNSPMMREDNIAAKDHFFKVIDQDIKKMSTMDLSKQQNVQAAAGVFSQLLENKNIVKDMVWTKNWQKEMRRSDGFRNCVDPDKCGGAWWEGGEKALQYKAMEFQNASADEALNFANVRYSPYQDVMKKAMALAKEAGLNISIDQLQGGYITTTKNGPMLVGPLQNLFMGSLGNDPMIADYYKTKSYVDRKDWVSGNASQYGSEEAAEQAYVAQMTPSIDGYLKAAGAQLEDKTNVTSQVRKKVETNIQQNGAMPGSETAQVYNDLVTQENAYRQSQGVVQEATNNLTTASNIPNAKYSAEYIDNAMASILLGQDINAAAQTLAYKDYEFKMKADEYGLESYRQKNRMLLEDVQHKNKLEIEKYKFDLKQYAEQLAATGGGEYNTPSAVDVMGGTDPGNPNEMSYEQTQQGFNQFRQDRETLKSDLSGAERGVLNEVYTATTSAAQNGDTQAQADLVAMVDAMANASMTPDRTLSGIGESDKRQGAKRASSAFTVEQAKEIKRQLADPNATHSQKYAIAKRYSANINNMAGSDVDEVYEGTIKHMYAKKNGNEVVRPHLTQVWEKTAENRRSIEAKYAALEQMDKWYSDESASVVAGARSSAEYGDLWADAFESYIDEKGHTVTKNKFVETMVSKGYSSQQASAMYSGDRRLKYNEYYDEETGQVKESFWSGVGNTLLSAVDAIGTTAAGLTGEIVNVVEWIIPGVSPEGEWGEGWGSEESGWGNWDYDSPNDVANWGGYGSEAYGGQGEGYGISTIGNRGYNDDLAMGAPGIHDMWKRAFSEYVSPDGNRAWLGINGAGNAAVQGLRFEAADPKFYRSTATMGTMGFLKDALNSSNTLVDVGGPKEKLPEASAEGASLILNTLYRDMVNMKKGDSRPIPQVTYQNIAGGDENMTALNIKLNQNYVNKYKGSEDNPGIMRPYMDALVNEGMTIYVPKSEATNIFASGSEKSHLEKLMGWRGEINMDSHPEYAKDFKITSDKQSGAFMVSGSVMAGLDERGNPIMTPYTNYHAPTTDLTNLVAGYDNLLNSIAMQNRSIVSDFNMKNGIKNPSELLNQ